VLEGRVALWYVADVVVVEGRCAKAERVGEFL
jgi:hypothetical protein